MSGMQALFMNYGPQLLIVDSADFDGANDYMTRGADLTGLANSKTGILSVWLRFDAGTGTQGIMRGTGAGSGVQFEVTRATSSGVFQIIGENAAGTDILILPTSSTFAAGATWYHFLASWDLANGVGHLYVSDASDVGSTTLTDDTIDYTGSNWGIGANPIAGTVKFDGCMAELYFAPGQYLDFSIVANRRKFISSSGKPVYLGADGSSPTGTAPIVYQRVADGAAVATFATNLGTGGDFAITGTLETGSTSPSD